MVYECGSNVNWLGTIRGRIGYAISPPLFVYATGGLAVAGIHNEIDFSPSTVNATTNKVGWTVGGGIEGILAQRWTWKAEYLYAEFGNTPTGCSPTSAPIVCFPRSFPSLRASISFALARTIVSDPKETAKVAGGLTWKRQFVDCSTSKAPGIPPGLLLFDL